ncbi:MAG: hypothetical protein CMP73_03075 [Flavobacteriales bacterium]|nr:hypothetical protein [Flavobacteriales bacterium]
MFIMTEMTYQMSEQAGLNPEGVFQEIALASGDTLATLRSGDVVHIRASVDEVSIGDYTNEINLILLGDIVWK